MAERYSYKYPSLPPPILNLNPNFTDMTKASDKEIALAERPPPPTAQAAAADVSEGMDDINQETHLDARSEERVDDLKDKIYEESKKIWRVALPSVVSRVTSFGTIVVTQSFIGHISSTHLAAYALVQTLTVRFVNGILIGMTSATETLCGQAFGARQYHMMGIFLQRSWLVDLITLTILLPIFILATPIFNLLGEDKDIAKSAGYISLWFIPVMYSIVFALTIQMFLQAQQKNVVIAWLSVVQLALHVPLSWLFVSVLKLGLGGAMAALCVSSWIPVFGEFLYIFGGWCPDSWKGFTLAAFKDILPVIKLSISSGVMICLELWYYAILVLVAGYMKNAEVAISAFSICLNVSALEFMITLGIMGAAIVRIANELGRGDAKAVKFSIKVLISTSVVIGLFFWVLCLVFGTKLGYVFSDKEDVARAVSDLYLLLAFTMLLNGIYPVLSGVAVGAGLQTKVAIINLVCFYGIGLPIGAVLGYVFHFQVKGIWIGMVSGVTTQTLAISFMTWKTNWDQEVSTTSTRLKRWYLKSGEEDQPHNPDIHHTGNAMRKWIPSSSRRVQLHLQMLDLTHPYGCVRRSNCLLLERIQVQVTPSPIRNHQSRISLSNKQISSTFQEPSIENSSQLPKALYSFK